MQNTNLEFIEKYNVPGQKPVAVIIWLHGLGADYNDFVPLVPELRLTKSVKFVFPNSPMRPITVNNGYVMRGWYDIIDLSTRIDSTIDFAGINQSVISIDKVIQDQLDQGFTAEQIIIAGFSQGGVMSYTTGLKSKHKLGGIIALSCYLPGVDDIIKECSNKSIKIFAAHGLQDPVVPCQAGEKAYKSLNAAQFNIQWHEYLMQHSVCNEEVADLSKWLNNIIQ